LSNAILDFVRTKKKTSRKSIQKWHKEPDSPKKGLHISRKTPYMGGGRKAVVGGGGNVKEIALYK
jgi:hypothetical protein